MIFLPLGKYSYKKTKINLIEEAEAKIKKAEALKEEAIKTINPDLCMQIRDMSDESLSSDYAEAWEASDYATIWNNLRKEKNLPIIAESYPLKDYGVYYYPCVKGVIEAAKKTEDKTFCEKFKDYLWHSECIRFFEDNEFDEWLY